MKKIIILLAIIIGLGALWYVVSPLFINVTVDEGLPLQTSPHSGMMSGEDLADQADTAVDPPTIIPYEMLINKVGTFTGTDNAHKGSGDLFTIHDGEKTFIRFEDFKVTNGPDLYVTLNKSSNPSNRDLGEHVLLEKLKGNQGSQNYDVSNYDLSEYGSVSIYCKAFSVLFATAQL